MAPICTATVSLFPHSETTRQLPKKLSCFLQLLHALPPLFGFLLHTWYQRPQR